MMWSATRPIRIGNHRLPEYLLVFALLPPSGFSFSQDPGSLSIPSPAPAPGLSDSSPSPPRPTEFEVEAESRAEPEEIEAGHSFRYEVSITWKGNQNWINLEPPEVNWPDGIRQQDVRSRSSSRATEEGPVGKKSFIYELVGADAGDYELPYLRIPLLLQDGSEKTVDVPGRSVRVKERPRPPSEKIGALIRQNWLILLGLVFVVGAGVVTFLVAGRKSRTEPETEEDFWKPIEEAIEKAEALRNVGDSRAFFGEIERIVKESVRIYDGNASADVWEYAKEDRLPGMTGENVLAVLRESEDRKFRPDRPRPEEMDRVLKKAKSVIRTLKAESQKKG